MEGFIIKLVLCLATVPGIFPRWRDTAIATGTYIVFVLVAFLWALNESGGMANIEGPSFLGIILLFGLIQFLLGLSYAAKFIAISLSKKLSKTARSKFLKRISIGFFSSIALYLVSNIFGNSGISELIEFIFRLLFALLLPLLWISLSMWLLPEKAET